MISAKQRVIACLLLGQLSSGASAVDTVIEQDLDQGIRSEKDSLDSGIKSGQQDLDRGVKPSESTTPVNDPREVSKALRSIGYQLWYPVPPNPSEDNH